MRLFHLGPASNFFVKLPIAGMNKQEWLQSIDFLIISIVWIVCVPINRWLISNTCSYILMNTCLVPLDCIQFLSGCMLLCLLMTEYVHFQWTHDWIHAVSITHDWIHAVSITHDWIHAVLIQLMAGYMQFWWTHDWVHAVLVTHDWLHVVFELTHDWIHAVFFFFFLNN
jgi:hypothetical protein